MSITLKSVSGKVVAVDTEAGTITINPEEKMLPIKFKEANFVFHPPAGSTEDVKDLIVYKGGGQIISKWKLSFRDKIKILFSGAVWLSILSDTGIPPVYVTACYPFYGGKQ